MVQKSEKAECRARAVMIFCAYMYTYLIYRLGISRASRKTSAILLAARTSLRAFWNREREKKRERERETVAFFTGKKLQRREYGRLIYHDSGVCISNELLMAIFECKVNTCGNYSDNCTLW